MTVSIIIAVKTWAKNLEECVANCLKLDFSNFEILILPDDPIEKDFSVGGAPINVIPTGPIRPADKRDIALKRAKGQILAFIDDDAYPDKNWLRNALGNFKDEEVAAVGGPAITAPGDTLRQKAGGIVYASFLVSGKYKYRYLPEEKRNVDDYPSCNFLVRKSVMQELGGFLTNFWPGEDTKLCLDIVYKLGRKIIYDPRVLVYHHRRPLFLAHLKQVSNYAHQRGFFVKRYPQTSLRLPYFIPTLFLFIAMTGAFLSLFLAPVRTVYFSGLIFYLFLVFLFSFSRSLRLFFLVSSGIILTHFAYGTYFLKGLLVTGSKTSKK